MAKKTKSSNLSIEERLEQALIPDGNAPYKLPDNWCWTHVKYCCDDFFCGKSPQYSKTDTGYHIIGQQANQRYGLDLRYIKFATKEFAESQAQRYWLRKKDVILNTLGTGSIGRSGIVNTNDKLLTDGHLFVFRTNKYVVPEYLFYYFQLTEEEIIRGANGSTNQKFLSLSSFAQYAIPVPPLAEQHRIVSRIESLFAKLDQAKEKAEEVVDGFDGRRAAILHRAFSGELTAKWRERNDVPDETWQQVKLGYLLEEIKYGTSEKSDYSFNGVPVLRIPNIGEMELLFDDVKQLQRGDCLPKEYLEENDILLIRSNGSKDLVGKCALVRNLDRRYTYASFLIRLRTIEDVLAEYIVWYLNSEDARKQLFRKAKSSAGIHNINSKEIADINIRISSVEEQAEVVRLLSNLIDKEKQVRETANAVIEKTDTMKKAILARAFRGELGTNDPAEESSIELLKAIVADDKI